MQCLSELGIDGVAYISKCIKEDSGNFPYAVNVAIPMKRTRNYIVNLQKKYL